MLTRLRRFRSFLHGHDRDAVNMSVPYEQRLNWAVKDAEGLPIGPGTAAERYGVAKRDVTARITPR